MEIVAFWFAAAILAVAIVAALYAVWSVRVTEEPIVADERFAGHVHTIECHCRRDRDGRYHTDPVCAQLTKLHQRKELRQR